MDEATWDLPEADRAIAPPELGPGAAIGRFVVRARLGAGGMGVVYAADDPDLGRAVALKLVRDDASPGLRARLLREAQAMARLEHAHVVRVFEVGTAGGRLYVAMELVDGETLTRWLASAPRTWREVVAKFVEIGAGLAAVHAAGLVHRDFKPDNVLVDRGGHARVADFGLARLDRPEAIGSDPASPALAAPLTRTGAMMGTPGYMAPEQQFGSDVDARADQYSFCVALREALGARWSAAPRGVRAAITRGLSYDPSERFPSIEALCAALSRALAPRRAIWIAGGAVALASAGAIVVGVAASRGGVIERDVGVREPPMVGKAAVVDAGLVLGPTELAARQREATEALIRARVAAMTAVVDAGAPAPMPVSIDARPAPAKLDRGPMPASHLAAIRKAVHDFGYQGFPRDIDAVVGQLEQQMEATHDQLSDAGVDDDMLAITDVIVGAGKRRAGDCRAARTHWARAATWFEAHDTEHTGKNDDIQLYGRGELGTGLCMLEAGDAQAAIPHLDHARRLFTAQNSNASERAEVRIALGMANFELGELTLADSWLKEGLALGNERIHDAEAAWMAVAGKGVQFP